MVKPFSRLLLALARPQYKEMALKNSGLAEIVHPFVGFLLFCGGKILNVVFIFLMMKSSVPDRLTNPFNVYLSVSTLLLCPLDLHFFLAYQEFTFFSFCSIHQTFAKQVLESSTEEPKTTQPSQIKSDDKAGNNDIVVYQSPRDDLHCNLEELIDLMKNMTLAFGPPLLQNLALMLLFWLLHVYCLVFVVIFTLKALFDQPLNVNLALTCGNIAGLVLIVR